VKIGTRVKLIADKTRGKELEARGLIGELGTTTDTPDVFGFVNVKLDNGASDFSGEGFVMHTSEFEVVE
jgi:hypothetical protein